MTLPNENRSHLVVLTLYEGAIENLQALMNIISEGTQTKGDITQHTTVLGTFADVLRYSLNTDTASTTEIEAEAEVGTLRSVGVTRIVYGIPTRIPDKEKNVDEAVRVLEDFDGVEEALAKKGEYPNASIYLIVYSNDDNPFSGKAQKLYDWVDDKWQAPT